MKTKRYFFVSDDLDDLERLEADLEKAGIATPQIHVLTLDDAAAETHHHLHDVQSLMKKDIIQSGQYGLAIGIAAAFVVMLLTWLAGLHAYPIGWLPFIFLAIVLLGFFTWEGGFIGIQTFNRRFKQFRQQLESGRHVFFVDISSDQQHQLDEVVKAHPSARPAGTGQATPHWLVLWQHKLKNFFVETMP